MMSMKIEPVILELAELDRFDTKAIIPTLPVELQPQVTDRVADVVSFAADCEWRASLVGQKQSEVLVAMHTSALASGMKPIVYIAHNMDNYNAIKNFLNSIGESFQRVTSTEDSITSDIVVTGAGYLSHNILRQVRPGIALCLSENVQKIEIYAMHRTAKEYGTDFPILGYEFANLIIGMPEDQIKTVVESKEPLLPYRVPAALSNTMAALYPGMNVVKFFTIEANQKGVIQYGVLNPTPKKMARLFNLYI
jgi:hypothetical protein